MIGITDALGPTDPLLSASFVRNRIDMRFTGAFEILSRTFGEPTNPEWDFGLDNVNHAIGFTLSAGVRSHEDGIWLAPENYSVYFAKQLDGGGEPVWYEGTLTVVDPDGRRQWSATPFLNGEFALWIEPFAAARTECQPRLAGMLGHNYIPRPWTGEPLRLRVVDDLAAETLVEVSIGYVQGTSTLSWLYCSGIDLDTDVEPFVTPVPITVTTGAALISKDQDVYWMEID